MFCRCVEKLSVLSEGHYRKKLSVCFGWHRGVVHFYSQIHDILNLPVDKQMPWELPCSFPTQQHLYVRRNMIWMTASQRPLQFQKCGSAFQNLMNISTLSNALVNIREELWLADSDIPPLRKKCSDQAGLPGSLPPCAAGPHPAQILGGGGRLTWNVDQWRHARGIGGLSPKILK